jgi:P4 family phage/plasmid primase-like protien
MNAYLASRQSQDKGECTHTRIGSKEHGVFGGSYHVDDDESFFQVYYKHVFVDGNKEYLTERQRECGPIGIDVDFRYTDAKRAYTQEHVLDFIDILVSELHKIFTIHKDFPIYLFEKSDISVTQASVVKDGIHFIVGLNVDMAGKTMLRNRMLKKMDVWSNLQSQLTNDWESVLDENVFKGSTAWQLYGSRKPGCEAYKLTKVYTCRKESEDYELHCSLGDSFPLDTELYKLSIRNLENETPAVKEAFKHEYEGSKQRKRIRVVAEPVVSTEITTHAMLNNAIERFLAALEPNDYRLNEAHQYVMCLPAPYYNDYDKWIRVGWALRHTDQRLFLSWIKFSSQSTKFSFADISRQRDNWDRSWDRRPGTDMVTIRSIMFWARTDNEAGYEQVKAKSVDLAVEDAIKDDAITEFDIATILYQLYKDAFVCVDIRSARWFQYTNQRWMATDSGTELRKHITSVKGIYGIFSQKTKQCVDTTYPIDDERTTNRDKKIKRIAFITKILKKNGDKIMHEASHIFYVKNFMNLLDSKDHLLCFTNGVVDFKERRFREGHPEDYTYKCTNIGYTPLHQLDQTVVGEVITFMNQLFPDKELCDYMWDHAASVLYGKNMNQTFNIYIGTGRNGKSKFVELMSSILGDYKATIPVSLITKQRVNIGGASPEVAGLVGIRYAVMQESSVNDRINEGPMKELTGGDAIQCRALYQEPITFIPQFKLVMPTNNLPNIESKDEGTWRRIRACEFKSQFKEDPDPTSKYQFPVDKNLDRKFESWKVAFMSLLVDRTYTTLGNVTDCKMVMMHSERYRKDQDGLASFVHDFVQLNPAGKIMVADLSAVFKEHWKMMYGNNVPNGKVLLDFIKKLYAENTSVVFGSSVWRGIKLVKDEVETMDEI